MVEVVVSDYYMPEMNGADLLHEVARIGPHIGRVLMSGVAGFDVARQVLSDGAASHVLEKPASVEEMVQTCRAAIHARFLVTTRNAPRDSPVWLRRQISLLALPGETLTQRQVEVAVCFYRARRVRLVSEELCISEHTVRNHLRAIYDKTGAAGQVQLLRRIETLVRPCGGGDS